MTVGLSARMLLTMILLGLVHVAFIGIILVFVQNIAIIVVFVALFLGAQVRFLRPGRARYERSAHRQ